MSQSMRLASLNKFKSGGRSILVATDVASRGLDIPLVDLVIVSEIGSALQAIRLDVLIPRTLVALGPFSPCRDDQIYKS
jgi:hypothetical protein